MPSKPAPHPLKSDAAPCALLYHVWVSVRLHGHLGCLYFRLQLLEIVYMYICMCIYTYTHRHRHACVPLVVQLFVVCSVPSFQRRSRSAFHSVCTVYSPSSVQWLQLFSVLVCPVPSHVLGFLWAYPNDMPCVMVFMYIFLTICESELLFFTILTVCFISLGDMRNVDCFCCVIIHGE